MMVGCYSDKMTSPSGPLDTRTSEWKGEEHGPSFDWQGPSFVTDCHVQKASGRHSYQRRRSSAAKRWGEFHGKPAPFHHCWRFPVSVG